MTLDPEDSGFGSVSSPPQEDPVDVRESTSVLGSSAVFKGEFTFEGDARIQGLVEGTISSKGEIRIDQGGHVKGNIHAATISVDGKVEGDLIATERLELLAHAEVRGDLTTKSLVVVQGAAFVGHVSVGPDANTQPKPDRASTHKSVPRTTRPKLDADWLPEAAPLSPVTSPVTRLPEWAGAGAVIARPAWMSGGDVKQD
jgi:cytoskeletal protein CcmA (bactofilin family)